MQANGACEFAGGSQQWLKSYSGRCESSNKERKERGWGLFISFSFSYADGRPHKAGEAVFADGSRFSGTFKEGVPEKGL